MANYRNKKILDLAEECGTCMICGAQDGTVVAAHSNQLRDGKGKGIKAHDFRVAYLCSTCHYTIDQSPYLSKEDRIETWERAHRNTIEWLFLNNHITIK